MKEHCYKPEDCRASFCHKLVRFVLKSKKAWWRQLRWCPPNTRGKIPQSAYAFFPWCISLSTVIARIQSVVRISRTSTVKESSWACPVAKCSFPHGRIHAMGRGDNDTKWAEREVSWWWKERGGVTDWMPWNQERNDWCHFLQCSISIQQNHCLETTSPKLVQLGSGENLSGESPNNGRCRKLWGYCEVLRGGYGWRQLKVRPEWRLKLAGSPFVGNGNSK